MPSSGAGPELDGAEVSPQAGASAEYDGFEALLPLADKERAGAAALGWNHRRMRRLLGRLGDPHLAMRCTLVAGSKGKGSTAVMLAEALVASGRRTGLYTQPHLARYAERVRLGGHPLRELASERARALLRAVLDAAPGPVTAFEAATAMAILAFAEEGASDAVLEVGFGGRLDATAESEPALVLLTALEREHVDVLGPTLAAVASSELALLRYGRACRSAAQAEEVLRLLWARARAQGADTALVTPPEPLGPSRVRLQTPGGHVMEATLGLPGLYQQGNAALAAAGAEVLGLAPVAIAAGLAAARWPGRFERVARRPDVVLDGAHTPGSARALAAALAAAYPGRRAAVVVGMLEDKDAAGFAAALGRCAASVWPVAPRHPRAMATARVAAAWGISAVGGPPPRHAGSLAAALDGARAAAGPAGLCVVTGSLHLVAEARAWLGLPPCPPGTM